MSSDAARPAGAPLPNPRHERFAMALVEGNSQAEAYRLAGYRPNRQHAARLVTNGDIQARVAELQAGAAVRHAVTVDALTARLEAARRAAMKDGKFSAAVAAVMGIAKLHGLGGENVTITERPMDPLDVIRQRAKAGLP